MWKSMASYKIESQHIVIRLDRFTLSDNNDLVHGCISGRKQSVQSLVVHGCPADPQTRGTCITTYVRVCACMCVRVYVCVFVLSYD
jgi:hypothetical protein